MNSRTLRALAVGDTVRVARTGRRGTVTAKRFGIVTITWDGGDELRLNWRSRFDRERAAVIRLLARGG